MINLAGQTDHRQLIRLAWHARGGLGPVTYLQHLCAAWEKPYICLLGGREPATWVHYRYRTVTIARNIVEALAQDVQLEIITYEGLSEPFLAEWLPRIGLPHVGGGLSLPGQIAPDTISNQNGKHYR